MSHDEMSETFKKWNEGELDSFLIEISANILNYRDEAGDVLLEKIKDSAGQKGTGKNVIYQDGLFGIDCNTWTCKGSLVPLEVSSKLILLLKKLS